MRLEHPVILTMIAAAFASTAFAQGPQQSGEAPTSRELSRDIDSTLDILRTPGVERRLGARQMRDLSRQLNHDSGVSLDDLSRSEKKQIKPALKGNGLPDQLERLKRLLDQPNQEPSASTREFLEHFLAHLNLEIERVVEPRMPALPVNAQPGVQPRSCAPGDDTFYPAFRSRFLSQTERMRNAARSVGRIIQRRDDGSFASFGTGFVVQIDGGAPMLATACHVVTEFADRAAADPERAIIRPGLDGRPRRLFVEFGDTRDVDWSLAFPITGVAFLPNLEGCDAALLQVLDERGGLPPPLPIEEEEIRDQRPQLASIGFPGPGGSQDAKETLSYFRCVRNETAGAAKFMVGGLSYQPIQRGDYSEIPHTVPTIGGQSGSPIFWLRADGNLTVIAIHTCCKVKLHEPMRVGDFCGWRAPMERQWQVSVGIRGLITLWRRQLASRPPS